MRMQRVLRQVGRIARPTIAYYRKISELLTPVLVVMIHIYACINLMYYCERPIDALLRVQYVCLLALLALQIHTMDRIWLWLLLLANAIMVPMAAERNIMSGFEIIYAVLLLALLAYRQIVLPRRVFLAMHLLSGIFLTWYVAVANPMRANGYYLVIDHAINPNMYGILCLAAMLHWMCFFEMLQVHTGFRLLGQGLAMVFGISLIPGSDCRSAMVALTVFLLLWLIWHRPWHRRLYQLMTVAIVAVLALFPIYYVRYAEQLADVMVLGSRLFSGREDLWVELFEWIRAEPIFGNGILFGSSSHHVLIELWTCLGVVPVISFALLCMRVDRRVKQRPCRISRIAQIAFLAALTIGCFESFFTDRYLSLFFLSFLLCAVEPEPPRTPPSELS